MLALGLLGPSQAAFPFMIPLPSDRMDEENGATPEGEAREPFPYEALRSDLEDYLADLAVYKMPFGRFRNWRLHSLPYEYLHWFVEKGDGFPSGRLGELMEFVYHTKGNGAEAIFSRMARG